MNKTYSETETDILFLLMKILMLHYCSGTKCTSKYTSNGGHEQILSNNMTLKEMQRNSVIHLQ